MPTQLLCCNFPPLGLPDPACAAEHAHSTLSVLLTQDSETSLLQAFAFGADCILLGRPICHGLAMGGQEGVERVLETLHEELTLDMALAGACLVLGTDFADVAKHHVDIAWLIYCLMLDRCTHAWHLANAYPVAASSHLPLSLLFVGTCTHLQVCHASHHCYDWHTGGTDTPA